MHKYKVEDGTLSFVPMGPIFVRPRRCHKNTLAGRVRLTVEHTRGYMALASQPKLKVLPGFDSC